jgi:hypothetical protein
MTDRAIIWFAQVTEDIKAGQTVTVEINPRNGYTYVRPVQMGDVPNQHPFRKDLAMSELLEPDRGSADD